MAPTVQIFIALVILLTTSRLLGECCVRFQYPAVVGEILAGVVVGTVASYFPPIADFVDKLVISGAYHILIDLAIFFLVLSSSVELEPSEITHQWSHGLSISAVGSGLSLALGTGAGLAFLPASELQLSLALAIGVALAVTDVPISARVLTDLSKLHSRPGRLIVTAALYDDIIGLILLAILTALLQSGALPSMPQLIALSFRVATFFLVCTLTGFFAIPWFQRFIGAFQEEAHEFTGLIVSGLVFGLVAEFLGLHFVIGAFLAGLFFRQRALRKEVCEYVSCKLSGTSSGFLAPIFFATIGLGLDVKIFWERPLFIVTLIVIAFVSKGLGCGVTARVAGLSNGEAASVGSAMCVRGTIAFIIADIANRQSYVPDSGETEATKSVVLSAITIVAIVTTLVSPIAMRQAFAHTVGSDGTK